MRLFLFVASHTRQKQNYKNYTSAVYCRNNGKAEPAPLLSNTRNVYTLDIVVLFVIYYMSCFFIIRNDLDFVKMEFILFKLHFKFPILTLILYNSVFQHKIAQSVM